MRVTDGRLDLAASHTSSASLDAHRQIQAWDQAGRVELTDDVKVTLGGTETAGQIRAAALDLARERGFGPGLGRGMGLGHGLGQGVGVRARGVPAMHMEAPRQPVRAPAVPAEDEPDPSEAEIARQAWMLLIRVTGDEQGAARLASRLAVFARRMEGAGDVAAVLDRVVAQYGAAASQASQAVPAEPSATPAQVAPAESWGYREDISVTVAERESVVFAAATTVTTADGRTINVAAAFSMAQTSITSITASVRKGAALHDPLALSFTTAAPSVGDGTQRVDVDNDGTAETVAALAPGTAYLVRDLNGNGIVDTGSELFGPPTQDGFGELAALDEDASGWVDEGDAAFAQLSLWNGQEGSALTSLADAGVGALATRNIATQYAYGARTGNLTASSIFLYEDGRPGFTGELELYA